MSGTPESLLREARSLLKFYEYEPWRNKTDQACGELVSRIDATLATGGWIPIAERNPEEGQNIWIAGYGSRGPFYAEAVFENGEWLMFDQETDQYCWPCVSPDYWMPIQPIPAAPKEPK